MSFGAVWPGERHHDVDADLVDVDDNELILLESDLKAVAFACVQGALHRGFFDSEWIRSDAGLGAAADCGRACSAGGGKATPAGDANSQAIKKDFAGILILRGTLLIVVRPGNPWTPGQEVVRGHNFPHALKVLAKRRRPL